MMHPRYSAERGYADHGWLQARHSFSFAEYYDPAAMGWGVLRVINEDRIAPGTGFGMHGHRDMEIVTYILDGALEHRDSLGNGGLIRRGEIQRMSAGRGILHSEVNPSPSESTHLLQIWLLPAERGRPASYEQRPMPVAAMAGAWQLIASPDGAEGSAVIGQDARLYATRLSQGETRHLDLAPGRLAYVHVVSGSLTVNGLALAGGDGLRVAEEAGLTFTGLGDSEVLVFDLPPAQP